MYSETQTQGSAIRMQRLSKTFYSKQGKIHALRNIDLEIEAGCCVGIVGHNGSGKSTLLRILSGLTLPTSGYVQMSGRVASVLEVGTGFHPDLSGWENLSLVARLLGLPRKVLQARSEAIVDFSGVRNYMDRPLKQYSQGMFLRLAFAVATEVDADVLLFDEVLSVGDASFQHKCRSRLEALKASGKTLLLVSHDLHQIFQFADKYLVLKEGQLQSFGDKPEVIATYVQQAAQNAKAQSNTQHTNHLDALCREAGLRIEALRCENRSSCESEHGLWLHLRLYFLRQQKAPQLVFYVHDFSGHTLCTLSSIGSRDKDMSSESSCDYTCHCPGIHLRAGGYTLSLYVVDEEEKVRVRLPYLHTFQIQVSSTEPDKLFHHGPFRLQHSWLLRHFSTTL